jgi:hypothetical protein
VLDGVLDGRSSLDLVAAVVGAFGEPPQQRRLAAAAYARAPP